MSLLVEKVKESPSSLRRVRKDFSSQRRPLGTPEPRPTLSPPHTGLLSQQGWKEGHLLLVVALGQCPEISWRPGSSGEMCLIWGSIK